MVTTEIPRGQTASLHPPLGSRRRLWRVLLPLLVGALVVALPVPAGLTTEADEPIPDGTLLVLINAEPDPVSFCFPTVPPVSIGKSWSTPRKTLHR